jgi:hypothetical protein
MTTPTATRVTRLTRLLMAAVVAGAVLLGTAGDADALGQLRQMPPLNSGTR